MASNINAASEFTISGRVEKFSGPGGWCYVAVPKKLTKGLKEQRRAWGMVPITVALGTTTWKTKLMMKKGGDFFVAIKASVRQKERVELGDSIKLTVRLR